MRESFRDSYYYHVVHSAKFGLIFVPIKFVIFQVFRKKDYSSHAAGRCAMCVRGHLCDILGVWDKC